MTFQQWQIRHGVSDQAMYELEQMLLEPSKTTGDVVGSSEAGSQQRIRAAAPHQCGILWRNNVGAFADERGVWVRYGICNDSKKVNDKIKSSDLIGSTKISYHGRHFGVFTAIECKKPGWKFTGSIRENAQLKFHNIVRSNGGIAGFATSVNDYQQIIQEYIT